MSEDRDQEQLSQLLTLIQEATERDAQLRQTYQIGEKFRFIRDRLNTLLENLQKETLETKAKAKGAREFRLEESEMLVYIHLYNAQGMVVRSWKALITPKAFFDYSVNRPIYQDETHIEAFVRAKANRMQHAYVTIAMKKEHVLPAQEEVALKDTLGNPLIKVKEGALRYERMVAFTHNEQVYQLSEEGELVKKTIEVSVSHKLSP